MMVEKIYSKCSILSKYDKLAIDSVDRYEQYLDNNFNQHAVNIKFMYNKQAFAIVEVITDPIDIERAIFIRDTTPLKYPVINNEMVDLFGDCFKVLSQTHAGVADYRDDIILYMITILLKLNTEKYHPYNVLDDILRTLVTGSVYGGINELLYNVRTYIEACKNVGLLPKKFSGEFTIWHGLFFNGGSMPPNTHPLHFEFRYNALRTVSIMDVTPWTHQHNNVHDISSLNRYVSAMLSDINCSNPEIIQKVLDDHIEELYHYPLVFISPQIRNILYGYTDVVDIIDRYGDMLINKYNALRIAEIFYKNIGIRSSYMSHANNPADIRKMIQLHNSGEDRTGLCEAMLALYSHATATMTQTQAMEIVKADVIGYLLYMYITNKQHVHNWAKVQSFVIDPLFISQYFTQHDILSMEDMCRSINDGTVEDVQRDMFIACVKEAMSKSNVAIYGDNKIIMEFILRQI